jgi:hypothetical protein
MLQSNRFGLVKGFLGLILLALLTTIPNTRAKAEEMTAIDPGTSVTVEEGFGNLDWNAIMSAMEDQPLTDGSYIMVGDQYRLVCEVIINPVIPDSAPSYNSGTGSSDDTSATYDSGITNSYSATCNVYVYIAPYSVNVATITHTISVTYYYDNKVHIGSGSLSASPSAPYWSANSYGYSINNTDGSYSSASGMVQLYYSLENAYYYWSAYASVTPGSNPSFSFSQA